MRFATIGAVSLPEIEHDAPRSVRASRLLRVFNLSIAVLLIALLGAAYWYAWRPLPQSSGQISAPISAEAAIARGVNYFIDTHRNRLPLEFTLLRYDPRPWAPSDCLLAGLEMYRTLTNSWRSELLKEKMLQTGERSKVDFLFPVRTGHEPQPGSNA